MNVPIRHVAAVLAASVLAIAAPAPAQAPLTVASPDSRNGGAGWHPRRATSSTVCVATARWLILPSVLGIRVSRGAGVAGQPPHYRLDRASAYEDVDPAMGRGVARAGPSQRAARVTSPRRRRRGGNSTSCSARSTTASGSATTCRRSRTWATFEIQDELTEFVAGRRRQVVVDPVEPAAPGPLGDAVLVVAGERDRQRANAAHDGDARRQDGPRDPRGESRRLRADEHPRAAGWRTARFMRRWRRGPTASR